MNPKIKEALAAIGALARAGMSAWPKSISFGILQDIRVQARAALALCDEEPTLGEELDIYERVVSICGQDRANKLIDLFKITSCDKQPTVPMAMLEHVWNGGYLSPDAEIKGEASLQQRKIDIDEIAARYGYKVV